MRGYVRPAHAAAFEVADEIAEQQGEERAAPTFRGWPPAHRVTTSTQTGNARTLREIAVSAYA